MMPKRTVTVAIVVFSLLAISACVTQDSQVDSLARQSEFAFTGTILQIRTSTIDATEVEDLAIVRVDEILSAVPPFDSLQSQPITVRLVDPDKAQTGQSRVFFTNGWHFGSSIGVVEVGHIDTVAPQATKELKAEISKAQQEKATMELKERLSQANLIVSGRVAEIRKSAMPAGVTEHDPDWHEAVIDVFQVLKGDLDGSRITILFPGSQDVIWYKAPKYKSGSEGLWLLKPFVAGGKELEFPAVVDHRDFYPPSEQPRIERLLAR